jgi:hypothetical protein
MYLSISKVEDLPQALNDAQSSVTNYRALLAKEAMSDEWSQYNTSSLNGTLHEIAEAEGAVHVLKNAAHYLEHESKPTPIDVFNELTSELLSGPDDGWSGNGNEVRRSFYKGKLKALNELKYAFTK